MAAAVAAAAAPSPFARVQGGLWEITRNNDRPATKLCVADAAALAQIEHQDAKCERSTVRESATSATIHYTCSGGGFGQSSVTVVTDRSLRVETQGIAANEPFKYVFQARRLGNCPAH